MVHCQQCVDTEKISILEFSTVVYGNGDHGDDSSLLVHELEFVPLDMASKYPTDTNFCSYP